VFEPGHLTDRKPPFRFGAYTRVAFSDTDAQGVVYYGRYLPYFDLARTEYHRQLGEIGAGRTEFVMRASNVEYHAPARFDDLLEVFVRVAKVGRSSVTYEYAAHKVSDDDALMVTATQTLVLIDHDDRTTRPVPDSFRSHVAAFEGAEL
jgi:acyl-CoA thioester hydrolase